MKTWMLAPITLLLSGAAVLPVLAQEPGQDGAARSAQGEYVRERGDERRDHDGRGNGGNRGNRDNGGDRDPRGSRREDGQIGRGDRAPEVLASGYAAQRGNRRNDARYDDRAEVRHDGRYENRNENRYDRRNDARYDARYDRRNDARYDNRYDNRYDARYDRRYDNRRGGYDRNYYVRHDNRRWHGNQWYPQYRYRAPARYAYPYGYRPYQWRVGHRLPASYYHSNYYVDYRAYQLPPPPYGYYWVRVDRDVVLVAAASGLIRDILYGLYY